MVIYGFEATYHGPTNTLSSRITVRSSSGPRRTFGYDYGAPCAFKAAVMQYIAADYARPESDRRFAHPPDANTWAFRIVFETPKSYIVVAYLVLA